MNLEESMSENGYIPEYSRVKPSRTIVDVQKKTAMVERAKWIRKKDRGGVVYKETTVNY